MKSVQTKKLQSTDHSTVKGTDETDHPWNILTTVTSFDQGNVSSTLCLDSINETHSVNGQVSQVYSSFLIESLVRQLCTLLETDRKRRRKLYNVICKELCQLDLIDSSHNMKEFEVLRKQYHHAFSRLFAVARAVTGNENISRSYPTREWSRYHEEFHEISRIAVGGFGEVYKALHRLDDIEYAIKKIILRSSRATGIDQYLKEVKTLAKLNHANIVPYKAAWIEPILSPFISTVVSEEHAEAFEYESVEIKYQQPIRIPHTEGIPSINDSNINDTYNTDSNWSNVTDQSAEKSALHEYTEDNTESSDIVSFRNSKSSENKREEAAESQPNVETESQTNMDYDIRACDEPASHQVCSYSKQDPHCMILYIQMTLCEQTLRQWMRERISQTPQPMIIAVLQQILCGVNYIHSQNIVHHDIKPSNIFISTSGQLQVQLGDFGLACPLQKETHRSIIGTAMYAAPEQLGGKCDPKSDIYSIGIILTQLLIPTHTHMELNTVMNCLKCGNVPQAVTVERTKLAHMIIRMVQDDPSKRPWTNELLQDLEMDKDNKLNELKQTVRVLTHNLHDRDITIHERDTTIHDKNTRIQELQDKITSLEAQVKKLKVSTGKYVKRIVTLEGG